MTPAGCLPHFFCFSSPTPPPRPPQTEVSMREPGDDWVFLRSSREYARNKSIENRENPSAQKSRTHLRKKERKKKKETVRGAAARRAGFEGLSRRKEARVRLYQGAD